MSDRSVQNDRYMHSLAVRMCAPKPGKTSMQARHSALQSKFPFLAPMLVKKGFPPYPKNILYGDVIQGLPCRSRVPRPPSIVRMCLNT